MKKIFFFAALAVLTLGSCTKEENKEAQQETTIQETQESNVQDTKTLKSSDGETVKVTYFAEGGMVAVKLQKEGQSEVKLTAKTVNAQGNPIFSNEEMMWEMNSSGTGGKLTDKDGNSTSFSEDLE